MKNSSEKNTCHCADPATMIIDRYSASRILAILMLILFFVFAAGYFLGKRYVAQETMLHTDRTAFADHVSFALSKAISDSDNNASDGSNQSNSTLFTQKVEDDQKPILPDTAYTASKEPEHDLHYRALLVGGTKRSITDFVQRLEKRSIKVEIRERMSKTAKGKTMRWYQAVTAPYSNRNELVTLVDAIKKLEKLKDVEIISMRSSGHADQKGNS